MFSKYYKIHSSYIMLVRYCVSVWQEGRAIQPTPRVQTMASLHTVTDLLVTSDSSETGNIWTTIHKKCLVLPRFNLNVQLIAWFSEYTICIFYATFKVLRSPNISDIWLRLFIRSHLMYGIKIEDCTAALYWDACQLWFDLLCSEGEVLVHSTRYRLLKGTIYRATSQHITRIRELPMWSKIVFSSIFTIYDITYVYTWNPHIYQAASPAILMQCYELMDTWHCSTTTVIVTMYSNTLAENMGGTVCNWALLTVKEYITY